MKKYILFILISIIVGLISCKEDAPTETIDDPNKVYFEGGPNIDSKGAYYTTVEIGNQFWLKENLNVGTMIQSSSGGQLQTNNGTVEKYCYNNETSNCDIYGGLYEWNEAMQYIATEGTQGICPSGWHIPTEWDWEILENYVDDRATRLIDENATNDSTYTNESGFSALFSGYRSLTNGGFSNLGSHLDLWGSAVNGNDEASTLHLVRGYSHVYFLDYNKSMGFSVRCLKD